MHLEGKRVSISEIKKFLHNLISTYTTLPEDVDINDALETTAELEN